MKQPLISIIIPIYKVEAYLDRCVQSVADQTYRNLEIILVDDGSPDRCPDICDSWSEKDSRIRVIHKENGGLSDARNAGIRAATGELIGFVDGDDYISGEMYEILYDRILADGSDIAACGVNMIWEDSGKTRLMTKEGTVVLNHEDAMRACIDETWLIPPVWNKLYRKELVNDLFFPVGKYHEDVFLFDLGNERTDKEKGEILSTIIRICLNYRKETMNDRHRYVLILYRFGYEIL